jgi:hypothetical protein
MLRFPVPKNSSRHAERRSNPAGKAKRNPRWVTNTVRKKFFH